MSKNYPTERHGQLDFFDKFDIANATELANYTDGVYKGTIFEFKKIIPNINVVLFQAIKYLSHLRINGESIPANILLVSLNDETSYLFKSSDYLTEIETIYAGAASRNNSNFFARTSPETIRFGLNEGVEQIKEILSDESFTKIHIDVFDVVGWAERFYSENPLASKIKLFDELRQPKHFSDYIYPWTGDEKDFKYIMDLLNDRQHKKELGAFYTPPAYCLKATELIREAIKNVPVGNDYIILDRCAGTGNLEEFLTDKKVDEITVGELSKYMGKDFIKEYLSDKQNVVEMLDAPDFNSITLGELEKYKTKVSIHDYLFDNEISHVIVNTYELKEWIVLNERIGDRVKLIIPPPQEVKNNEALVDGGDALSKQFVIGQKSINLTEEYSESINILQDYIKDSKTNILLYENPPFSDSSADNTSKIDRKGSRGLVYDEFKREISDNAAHRDLSNLFIWSGWKYYLTKPNDAFILFSPIKYWKSLGLGDHKFIKGFLFNRAHFHAGASSIACILWLNEPENRETLKLEAFDIDTKKTIEQEDDEIVFIKEIEIKKVHKSFTQYQDKRIFDDDERGVCCSSDGKETIKDLKGKIPLYNKNIVGFMFTKAFPVDAKHYGLYRVIELQPLTQSYGYYLRVDNFIDKLPLFAAKLFPQKVWYERDVYFTTADGGVGI